VFLLNIRHNLADIFSYVILTSYGGMFLKLQDYTAQFVERLLSLRKFVFCLMITGFLYTASQALAQSREPNEQINIYEMSLEELMEVELPTVSTASKYE
jgi:hypothetical protein